jgi:magnesium-transporting ATPase (P-type)
LKNKKAPKPRFNRFEIVLNISLAAIIIFYSSFCLIKNEFYVPSKRGFIVFRDESALLTFFVFLIAALNILSNVINFYDKRDNAESYRKFKKITFWLGWTMLVLSLVLDTFVFHKGQVIH